MDDSDRRKVSINSVLICEICKKRCKNVTIFEECCHGSPSPSPSSAPSSSNANGKGKKGRHEKKKKQTNNIIPPPPPSSPPPAIDHHEAVATSNGTRVHPIWFTYVACDNQECPSPLPQISSRYIKIKDVNMPAFHIKRYLEKKLSLQSKDEDKSPSSDTTYSGEATPTTANMDKSEGGEYVAAQSPAQTIVQHLDGQTYAHVESSLDSEGDSHMENGSDSGNSSDDDCDNPAYYHSQEAIESPEVTELVSVSNPQVIHLEVDLSK
ncbi:Polycomb group RING finger protein 5 [Datura stramonium]|uniref:Polycomb group RING finger protein 5 n=1 Tax=Datura stramonium TaxID=4076 RepID=A0ABS8TLI7_DATST|nr:Polycomb group RING finger protein 5 [Datura stramonium]